MRGCGIVTVLAVGTLCGGAGQAMAQAQTIPVGVARVEITPGFPVRLHGYAVRKEESKGVQQKLWAKALAIGSDEQGPAVLITVDSLGVPDAMVEQVARALKDKAHIERRNLAVAASHTHSAPCVSGVAPNIFGTKLPADQQEHIDRYTRELAGKLEQVALAALHDRQPGTLAWGQGQAAFAANRRTKGGPVDHRLPMLRVADPQGKLRAIVVGYACHCTTLDPADNLVSADWAGDAQEAIEADHPGATALVVIGCGADANPLGRVSRAAALRHGREVADEVNRLLRSELKPLPGPPVGRLERIALPFDTLPTRDELETLVKAGGAAGYNARTQLERLDRGEPLQAALDYPVQSWQFGNDLVMVFLAGEVVVDYVLRLRHELDPERLWVVAYANDLPCYIPSERILREGGYEGGGAMVYYGRPTRLKPGIEDAIDRAVRSIVPRQFEAQRPGTPKEAAAGAAAAAEPDVMPPPLSPEEALRSFRVKPGLTVELVAAEPLVVDPVAIDFGADGKLWVCEMRDYPTGMDGHWKPGGRIKFLEDGNGDGRYDRATVFLEDVPFPTGLMAWRGGVLVCAAPEILYAEDTNGDGQADLKRTLFTGFATENYQARVNGLSYGLDNWVYGANGLIGGRIRGLATGKEVAIGGRDFRILPDTGAMEPASGLTQQGRVRDDRGHQFGGSNSVLLQHYPLPDHYASRNPHAAAPGASVHVSQEEDSAPLYPASRTVPRFNHPERANRVTSACSPLIYRDNLLGDNCAGNAFICEPVHNLVHREVLEPDGVTFTGHRAGDEPDREFLASTDNWCRPVQVRTGPDGAIYVVDMYRYVIEHPRWISPEQLAKLDVRAGDDKGRIYRVRPAGQPLRPVPALDRLATPALAAQIDSRNGTLRDNVQRLLVHRADRAAVPVLGRIAQQSRLPEARLQALCTLDGLHALTADQVRAALDDPAGSVREQAVRLAEPWLARDEGLGAKLAGMARDPDIHVRFQLALSLGEWDDSRAGEALGKIAVADAGDAWMRAAVLSSAARRTGEILRAVFAASLPAAERSELVEPLIATAAATAEPATLAALFEACTERDAQSRAIAAWRLSALAELLAAADHPGARARALAEQIERRAEALRPAFEAARALAADDQADPAERATAVRLLGRDPAARAADLDRLGALLDPRTPAGVQAAAVRALGRMRAGRVPEVMLARWASLGPALRAEVLDALLARAEWTDAVLTALERGTLARGEIDAAHRQRLLKTGDPGRRARAAAVLAGAASDRQAVVKQYDRVLTQRGDPARGSAVFGKVCASCHRLGGQGHEVGPDLAALTDTSPQALMIAVLDPNREVDARYASYTAALADGRVLTGLIAAETASAITLKRQESQADVILRGDLEALRTDGHSLMPEGLEKDLTPDALADVIAYVASGAAAPKSFPGNRPESLAQAADGTVRLGAASAAIFGDTLVFESELGNLGYWHSANDRAAWMFRVDRPATFTVTMEWACADDSAGNPFEIRIGDRALPGVVGATGAGTWANYRSIFVGEITLPAGTHRCEFRPRRPPRGALLDLRAVVLTPRGESVFGQPKKP